MVKVCMVTTSYPRWRGDAGEFLADLARHLVAEQDVQVTVLAPGHPDAPAVENDCGVEIRRLRYFWPAKLEKLAYGHGIPWNLRRSVIAWLNIPFFFLAFGWQILRRGRRADVIHGHWGILGALAVFLRPLHRRPVMITVHGTDLRISFAPIRWITRWAIRRANIVTTPSPDFRDACAEIRGSDESCHFVPHGLTFPGLDEIRRARKAATGARGGVGIVTVGRLIVERRHALLIRAFARFRAETPSATLTIVGDGPERASLESLIEQLGLSEAVRLVGRVAAEDVAGYLLSADLYVSPTTVDTFGLATVEAAAHGLAVITTNVGFPPTLVIEGESGYVVQPDDEDALLEAMKKIISSGKIAAAGARMHQCVEEMGLTWPRCAAGTADLYRAMST